MYVDPMTLFILGEILVVYIIINVFLFYKSRLYKVLVALLKEIRFERLRRQQQKQQELADLRKKNKDLFQQKEVIEKDLASAGKPLSEQLNEHVNHLNEQYEKKDLINSVEQDQTAHWLRLRILELEEQLVNGSLTEENWHQMATDAIARLVNTESDHRQGVQDKKDGAEENRYTGQLEQDLEEAQRLYQQARVRIQKLESELEEHNSIATPSERQFEAPKSGRYEDEIYQLRCDNFDLQETINKLKLEIQQANPEGANDAYVSLLEQQIATMEQYIKSADIASGLMEKEIEAGKLEINKLQEDLEKVGNATGSVDLSSLKQLSKSQSDQTDTLSSIKDTIERLRSGESSEAIAQEQEAQIARLEQIIRESDQCIKVLEHELSQSAENLKEMENKLADKKSQALSDKLSSLQDVQTEQKTGVNSIRKIIGDIRSGGEVEKLLSEQEAEISRLERFISESDTLVGQMEEEIDRLNSQLAEMLENFAEVSSRPDSSENMDEMETLLQQFIVDIQSLLKKVHELEDENKTLQHQIDAEPPSASSPTEDPPVITDVEP